MADEKSADGGEKKQPDAKKKQEFKGFSMLLVVVLIILVGLFFWAERNRRSTEQELETTISQLEELQNSTDESSENQANKIIDQVRELIEIPLEPRPTVATITDVDRLKEANPFFAEAQNGNYLILTTTRAVLFDAERNIVLDVAPFQITASSPGPSPGESPSGSAEVQPTADTLETEPTQ